MQINDKTRPVLEKCDTATQAALMVWKAGTPGNNKCQRLRRVWNGKGWTWPAKWTVRGRKSQWFDRQPKTATEAKP